MFCRLFRRVIDPDLFTRYLIIISYCEISTHIAAYGNLAHSGAVVIGFHVNFVAADGITGFAFCFLHQICKQACKILILFQGLLQLFLQNHLIFGIVRITGQVTGSFGNFLRMTRDCYPYFADRSGNCSASLSIAAAPAFFDKRREQGSGGRCERNWVHGFSLLFERGLWCIGG